MNQLPAVRSAADLLAEMADAEDSIRQETRELLWRNSVLILAGVFLPSLALVVCGILVLGAVWALRRHRVPFAGVCLSVAVCALVVYGGWRTIQQPTMRNWIHVIVLLVIEWQLVHATLAAIHHRRLSALYRLQFGEQA